LLIECVFEFGYGIDPLMANKEAVALRKVVMDRK